MKGFSSTKGLSLFRSLKKTNNSVCQETLRPLTKQAVSFSPFYRGKETEQQKQVQFVIRQEVDIKPQFLGSQGTHSAINRCTPAVLFKRHEQITYVITHSLSMRKLIRKTSF